AAAHRGRIATSHHQPATGDFGAGASDSPFARWVEESAKACRLVSLFGADGRGQDRSGAVVGRLSLWLRARDDPLRYVGVYGEAFGLEADRLAARLCRLRRGRAIDRARAAQSLFSAAL